MSARRSLWTTIGPDADATDPAGYVDAYLWDDREAAQENADAGGHDLVEVVVEIMEVRRATTHRLLVFYNNVNGDGRWKHRLVVQAGDRPDPDAAIDLVMGEGIGGPGRAVHVDPYDAIVVLDGEVLRFDGSVGLAVRQEINK